MSAMLDKSLIETQNETVEWNKLFQTSKSNHRGSEEVLTSSSRHLNHTQKSIKKLLYNETGYIIEDEEEAGLNDLQTLFLACFGTLIPLVITFLTVFGIRILWKKYKKYTVKGKYDGILYREETSESIARPLHSHLLNEKSVGETHLALNTDDVEICDTAEINSQIRSNNHSSTNGSIITMTLKNNHLIVEREERNDIEEDSRETKLKYYPGDSDGVFVVEVQQGIRRRSGSGEPILNADPDISGSISDECALVHNPPERYSDVETEECDNNECYIETASPIMEDSHFLATQTSTGLAQSNMSLSHPSYCYTTQQCYDNGCYGYNIYIGYVNDEIPRRLQDDTRPKIMSAVYKKSVCDDMNLSMIKLNGLKETIDEIEKSDEKFDNRNNLKSFKNILEAQ